MANSKDFVVCVGALKRGEYRSLPDDLKVLLMAVAAEYDVSDEGNVYGESRNEWAPFKDGNTIWGHLQDAEPSFISLSDHWDSLDEDDSGTKVDKRKALLKSVDLYIFDPAFLTMEGRYSTPLAAVESAIINDPTKQFCVIMPGPFEADLHGWLERVCEEKLPLLKSAFTDEGRGEWLVGNADRLRACFNGLRRGVVADKLQQLAALMKEDGVKEVTISLPYLLAGAPN